jgi:peptidoglycan-associated lipoprotein
MLAEGVATNQIGVISYGEERPVDVGGSEAAWSRNRRVELVY